MAMRTARAGHSLYPAMRSTVWMCSGRTPMPISRAGSRLQWRKPTEQAQRPRWRHRSRAAEHPPDHLVLYDNLQPLRHPGWEFAPLLNRGKMIAGDSPRPQRLGENVGSRHRILDGEIDADSADRRHRMRGIADADQARAIPFRNRSTATVSSLISSQLFSASTRSRSIGASLAISARNAGRPGLLDVVESVLGDDEGALPVVAAVDHDEDVAGMRRGRAYRRRPPACAAIAATARPSAQPRSSTLKPALARTVECRPSVPTMRRGANLDRPVGRRRLEPRRYARCPR